MAEQTPDTGLTCAGHNSDGSSCGNEGTHLVLMAHPNESGGVEHLEKAGTSVLCPKHATKEISAMNTLVSGAKSAPGTDTSSLLNVPIQSLKMAKPIAMKIPKQDDGSLDFKKFGENVQSAGFSMNALTSIAGAVLPRAAGEAPSVRPKRQRNAVEHFYAAQREHKAAPAPSHNLSDEEVHNLNLERKSYGLDPMPFQRGPGRPQEGISQQLTTRVTTRSIERALPWDRSEDRPITALKSEERRKTVPQVEKVTTGTAAFGKQFPSEDLAPSNGIDTPIRRTFIPEFTPRKLVETKREYDFDHPVVQHPSAAAGTPVTWLDGKAVHVARIQKDTGGTVWLPNRDKPAVEHEAGCKNKDNRGNCSTGCRPLTYSDLYGDPDKVDAFTGQPIGRRSTFRHMQEVHSRRSNADMAASIAQATSRARAARGEADV